MWGCLKFAYEALNRRAKPRPSSPNHHVICVLFWDIIECGVIIPYRHFGTTCCSHLQGPRNPKERIERNWSNWHSFSFFLGLCPPSAFLKKLDVSECMKLIVKCFFLNRLLFLGSWPLIWISTLSLGRLFFWGGGCCLWLESSCIQVDVVNKAGYDFVSTSYSVHPSFNCILSVPSPLLKSETKPTDSAVSCFSLDVNFLYSI